MDKDKTTEEIQEEILSWLEDSDEQQTAASPKAQEKEDVTKDAITNPDVTKEVSVIEEHLQKVSMEDKGNKICQKHYSKKSETGQDSVTSTTEPLVPMEEDEVVETEEGRVEVEEDLAKTQNVPHI